MLRVSTCLPSLPRPNGVRNAHGSVIPSAYERSDALLEVSKEHSGRLTYVPCNVLESESIRMAFARAEQSTRHYVRGLVTCAGISGQSAAIDYAFEDFRRIMDVNVTGTFLCAQEAARLFRKHAVGGSIVMLASMSAHNVNQVGAPLIFPPSDRKC